MKIISTDILVIGAGIAGCGLAYNLRRKGYRGKIVVLEKKDVGANCGYGYRNTDLEHLKEYNISFKKKFTGSCEGIEIDNNTHWIDVDTMPSCYFSYKEACLNLLKCSQTRFVNDLPLELLLENNHVKCKNGNYTYQFLIDCSGWDAWARKQLGFWQTNKCYHGKTCRIPLTDILAYPKGFNPDFYYFLFDSDGYMEDAYLLGDSLLVGYWKYGNTENDFCLKPERFLGEFKLKNDLSSRKFSSVRITTEPVFPLVYKNIAWLGDSAGQVSQITFEGIAPTLDASKLLAEIIFSKQHLEKYQQRWISDKNLLSLAFHHCFVDNQREHNKFFKRVIKQPGLYRELAVNKVKKLPLNIIVPTIPYFLNTCYRTLKKYFEYRSRIKPRL